MGAESGEKSAVVRQLERCGWTVTHRPAEGRPAYEWRSPSGVSEAGFRSDSPEEPPAAVIEHAVRNGSLTGG